MYSIESKEILVNRVGWYPAIQPSTIVLTDENTESVSGRYFNGFNSLVTVENVFASLSNKDATNETLQVELERLKSEGVSDVLGKVFDTNTLAAYPVLNNVISLNYALDYSNVILDFQQVFDEAIGYSVAVKTMEMIATTIRSNRTTVSNIISLDLLYQQLEGSFTQEGRLVSQGARAMYAEAIGKVINVLFPVKYPDGAILTPDGDGGIVVALPLNPTLKGNLKLW